MGALLGRFSDVLETLGAEKSQKLLPEGVLGSEKVDVKKNMKKRSRKAVREIRGISEKSRHLGWGALKQSHKPRPTDPLDTL